MGVAGISLRRTDRTSATTAHAKQDRRLRNSALGGKSMKRMVVKSKLSRDGVLHLTLPVGLEEAEKEVQVTVEPVAAATVSQEAWRQAILATAGKWQGEFE